MSIEEQAEKEFNDLKDYGVEFDSIRIILRKKYGDHITNVITQHRTDESKSMTVAKLIEKLSEFPKDAVVYYRSGARFLEATQVFNHEISYPNNTNCVIIN